MNWLWLSYIDFWMFSRLCWELQLYLPVRIKVWLEPQATSTTILSWPSQTGLPIASQQGTSSECPWPCWPNSPQPQTIRSPPAKVSLGDIGGTTGWCSTAGSPLSLKIKLSVCVSSWDLVPFSRTELFWSIFLLNDSLVVVKGYNVSLIVNKNINKLKLTAVTIRSSSIKGVQWSI